MFLSLHFERAVKLFSPLTTSSTETLKDCLSLHLVLTISAVYEPATDAGLKLIEKHAAHNARGLQKQKPLMYRCPSVFGPSSLFGEGALMGQDLEVNFKCP